MYARHGRDCCGVRVPCTRPEVSRSSVYQVNPPIDKVRDEGSCGRATDRGKEACECARKCRPDHAAGRILVKAARRRIETSYKAGSTRRVSTTSRSRFRSVVQVNDALVQRSITFLSGEICTVWLRPGVAPTSRACPKPRNSLAQVIAGGAEVSRGRSTTAPRGRKGRTMSNKEELRTNSTRGYYSDRSKPGRRALDSQP